MRHSANHTLIFNETYFRRLDCAHHQRWSLFRRLLQHRLESGEPVGLDLTLQLMAEELLAPMDSESRDFFQHASLGFKSHLIGEPSESKFCFPGYQAACWVRIVGLRSADEPQLVIESNAQHCSSIFGKEASLDFISSTAWPITLLDLEIFMEDCPDSSFGMRGSRSLPQATERFSQFRAHLGTRGSPPKAAGTWPSPSEQARAPPNQSVIIASVFGGHCALWLEPLYTLYAIFPELVQPFLVTYNQENSCPTFPTSWASVVDVDVLALADIHICMWVSECSRLRSVYGKPVIFYSGFLLLNDQSFQKGHPWGEALEHFWRRLDGLYRCTWPPCLVAFEEPQLAAAAQWQTGYQGPYVRPLSLYVQCRHDPRTARDEVLVINRGRLISDAFVTRALNAMRHVSYPYRFKEQQKDMAFEDMAEHRSVVLMPWDLNLMMFHDLYAMALPMLLPDKDGLHHRAFAYLARFQKSLAHDTPFDQQRGAPSAPHPFSPFDVQHLLAREYWLDYTEYLRAPALLHFASLPHLLLQVLELDGLRIHRRMRAENLRALRESRRFWSVALHDLLRHRHVPRAACGAHPASVLESPMDGPPWQHQAASRAEPLLAFLPEPLAERLLQNLPDMEVTAGAFDWNGIQQLGCEGRRHVRCLLLALSPWSGFRLLSTLDPGGFLPAALWRLRSCVVLTPGEGVSAVLEHHFPYIPTQIFTEAMAQPVRSWPRLSELVLFRAARRQFRSHLRRVKEPRIRLVFSY